MTCTQSPDCPQAQPVAKPDLSTPNARRGTDVYQDSVDDAVMRVISMLGRHTKEQILRGLITHYMLEGYTADDTNGHIFAAADACGASLDGSRDPIKTQAIVDACLATTSLMDAGFSMTSDADAMTLAISVARGEIWNEG